MIRIYLSLFVYLLFLMPLCAQTDTAVSGAKPGRYDQIAKARQALQAAFLDNDQATAQIWKDSLMRLENDQYTALIWDERWLLYFWEESYGNLFEEVARFDDHERSLAAYKIQPPPDSLYEWLDRNLYEKRYDMFRKLREGFLSEEERVFSTLMLEYLLRMNVNARDWNTRVDSFAKRYPNSRFNRFLKTTQTFIAKPGKSALNLDLLFQNGNWRDETDRSLKPLYAGDFGLAYWQNRWNFGFHFTIGRTYLDRDLYVNTYLWPKKDKATFMAPELEFGYDIINSKKLRIFPSLGAGVSILRAPQAGDENNPLPDYYINFKLKRGFLMGTLTTDVKLKHLSEDDPDIPQGSYQSIRLRLGYRRLFLGELNHALRGDMVFLAVGINFHLFTQEN
ncbi:MAG: hypothetical protein WCR52_11820 [Bacteroidota bacterium]